MSKNIEVARVNRTGALIRLHDGNRSLLDQPGIALTEAAVDEKTGRLVEVDGADRTAIIAASSNLVRIGEALVGNKSQRETLLTSALKLPGAEAYLESIGVYKGTEDDQYIDVNTLHANNSGLPEKAVQVGVVDVTEELNEAKPKAAPKRTPKKKAETKVEDTEVPDELADL